MCALACGQKVLMGEEIVLSARLKAVTLIFVNPHMCYDVHCRVKRTRQHGTRIGSSMQRLAGISPCSQHTALAAHGSQHTTAGFRLTTPGTRLGRKRCSAAQRSAAQCSAAQHSLERYVDQAEAVTLQPG
jgi:hypothetical protein